MCYTPIFFGIELLTFFKLKSSHLPLRYHCTLNDAIPTHILPNYYDHIHWPKIRPNPNLDIHQIHLLSFWPGIMAKEFLQVNSPTNLGIGNLVVGNPHLRKIASAQGSANPVGADFLQPKPSFPFGQHCGCSRCSIGGLGSGAAGDHGRRHGRKEGSGRNNKQVLLLVAKQRFRIAHQTYGFSTAFPFIGSLQEVNPQKTMNA